MNPGDEVTKTVLGDKTLELIYIGNEDGKNYYYRKLQTNGVDRLTSKFTVSNNTSVDQNPSYTEETGSQYGFTEKVGIKVSGSAGVPFVTEGKVEISGELTFSQAFSKLKSVKIPIHVPPGKTVTVYEAEIAVEYYREIASMSFLPVIPYKTDVIDTGSYEIVEYDNSDT